jgi:hypothetical protein
LVDFLVMVDVWVLLCVWRLVRFMVFGSLAIPECLLPLPIALPSGFNRGVRTLPHSPTPVGYLPPTWCELPQRIGDQFING